MRGATSLAARWIKRGGSNQNQEEDSVNQMDYGKVVMRARQGLADFDADSLGGDRVAVPGCGTTVSRSVLLPG
jgi:hypothetical protein